MKVGLVVFGLLLSGCALRARTPPPSRPVLPEIPYVAPCDPKAVAGLTEEAVEALRNRDLLLRRHILQLEQQLQSSR